MPNKTLTEDRRGAIPRQVGRVDVPIAAVEGMLADFLAGRIAQLDGVDTALGSFARSARDLVLRGGKRLRPTFAYWGWRGVVGPGEPVESIVPALAALELTHTFALVHDDVMDGSATRRGGPSAHRMFAAQHAAADRRGDPERFGANAAILVGDLCLVWADQLLNRSALPAPTLLAARACYDAMRIEAVSGQYLDVLGEFEPGAWSVSRALLVAQQKTASYSVRRPLLLGRTLTGGGGSEAARVDAAYDRYGAAVGEAFQLRDDLLGAYGDPAVTGKPTGEDLRTGKPTTLLMLAVQLATPAQRAELTRGSTEACFPAEGSGFPADGSGSHDAGRSGLDSRTARLAEIVAETGAPTQVEGLIERRVADGIAALNGAPIDPQARAALIDLAVTAANRPA